MNASVEEMASVSAQAADGTQTLHGFASEQLTSMATLSASMQELDRASQALYRLVADMKTM
ncbi:hypothetical protein MO973_21450 [Paenibacillus sp. TRM 82003]|nr:hypothetical protein [Paenibacillus sp. TRM 82003]